MRDARQRIEELEEVVRRLLVCVELPISDKDWIVRSSWLDPNLPENIRAPK